MRKLFLIVLGLALSGCWNMQSWKYTAEAKSYKHPQIEKSLVVPPMRDVRDNKNNTDGRILAWIPFVPYSRMCQLYTPEGVPDVMPNMGIASEALAKTTAEELSSASLFKNAYFDFNTGDADLILKGTLKEFKVEHYYTLYGVSFLGEGLWVLGLPIGREYNSVVIEYQLVDQKGREFFKKEYTQKDDWEYGLYKGLENYRFEKLMKQINMDLVKDLASLKNK